jgi:NitT/TauT family transport system substrate-binding protein
MKMRKILCALFAAFLAVTILSGVASAAKVKVTFSSIGYLYTPFFVGQDLGFFKENGLEVEEIRTGSGSKAATIVISGDAQFYLGTVDKITKAKAKGKDLLAVCAMLTKMGSTLAIRKGVKPGIEKLPLKERIPQIKGLTIGVTGRGSGTDVLARYIIKNYSDLDPERDVNLMPIGKSSAYYAAMKTNKVDIIVRSEPVPAYCVKNFGARYFVDIIGGEIPFFSDYLYISVVGSKDYIEQHPDITRAFVKGMVKAERLIRENPDKALQVMKERMPKVDPGLHDLIWKSHKLAYAADGRITKSGVDAGQEFILFLKKVKKKYPFDEIATNKYLP